MPRWAKLIIGILLIPLCLGSSQALFWVLSESGHALRREITLMSREVQHPGRVTTIDPAVAHGQSERAILADPHPSRTWVPLLAGVICWGIIYVMLPRPMWVYVFGHELTHVIWAWVFESRVKRFQVSAHGGHVVLSDVNFIIMLSPYFFPIYALLVALFYTLTRWWFDPLLYRLAFLLFLGASYAFHVSLTLHALQTEQTDITSQGWLFSMVVIWLGNLAVLIPGLTVLLGVPLGGALHEVFQATLAIYHPLARLLGLA